MSKKGKESSSVGRILKIGKEFIGDDIMGMIFGTYVDNGKPRSLFDALDDELVSPKKRAKALSKKSKKSKKIKL